MVAGVWISRYSLEGSGLIVLLVLSTFAWFYPDGIVGNIFGGVSLTVWQITFISIVGVIGLYLATKTW